jgi:hypothetical protein
VFAPRHTLDADAFELHQHDAHSVCEAHNCGAVGPFDEREQRNVEEEQETELKGCHAIPRLTGK